MQDFVADLTVGMFGSLAAAGLLYLLGRFLTRDAGQTHRPSSLANTLIPSLPRIDAKEPRGALFPKPRTTPLVLCLLFGFTMGWLSQPRGLADDAPRVLRDEAETILNDARYKAEQIIQEAQYRASWLMSDASREEAFLRITEQAKTAERVILLAEEEARRLMETAHHQAKTIQEDARQRAQRLLHEADLRLATSSTPTLGNQLRDQVMRLIIWPLRGIALFALVGFILGTQASTHIYFTSVLAASFFSLILALFDVIADVSGLAFFVPMFIAAIVYAGMCEELSPGQLLLAAFHLLYQRFGIVLGLVALQFVIIATFAGFGSSIGIAIVAIARAAGWDELIRLGGWLISMVGILIGASIGREFAHALAAVSFASVLSGLTSSNNTPTTPDVPPQ